DGATRDRTSLLVLRHRLDGYRLIEMGVIGFHVPSFRFRGAIRNLTRCRSYRSCLCNPADSPHGIVRVVADDVTWAYLGHGLPVILCATGPIPKGRPQETTLTSSPICGTLIHPPYGHLLHSWNFV